MIGVTISIIVVQFLRLDLIASPIYSIDSAPAFVIGMLILPLFDTVRIFSIRILQGKSPFRADRQHLHHRLLELGYTHLQSTIILLSANIFFIVLCYILQDIGNIPLISITLAIALISSYTLLKLALKRSKRQSEIESYLLSNLDNIVKSSGRHIKKKEIRESRKWVYNNRS
jgi:hypothetical protein